MGERSSIEWTHHTFNPWWGCVKVSTGCKNCYAEAWAKRTGHDVWGANAPRRTFGEKHWREPLRWNAKAKARGVRERVFVASMADICEDHPVALEDLPKLWELIRRCEHLDWLLLTKRPERFRDVLPHAWRQEPPRNVCLMTTVEDQEQADKRIPALMSTVAAQRGLSYEPAVGPIDIRKFMAGYGIDWVIAGGESGPGARPANVEWFRSIRDQCAETDTPFLFKQWGDWVAPSQAPANQCIARSPETDVPVRLGKKVAGRELDGEIHDGFPGGHR